ncbi:RING-H2 finger protein ATL8 [Nicotiana tabacum]|uniref:RING-H2 finger protein ATL8 n=2 Tax=Nicotiana TaxID=4085 RepID=A0A1S4BDU1_TOBAC|nr:PREDICTED: RING-H2 finger protein ATL8-like [Nicotiana sylvestris]XP_016487095.1 PREDICTED: RING-H2 finger protein ATL8-like [Nicotiana tabacum]
MTRPPRFLLNTTNSSSTSPPPPNPAAVEADAEPPYSVTAESDFVVILAALLCAVICVSGLIVVARCTWLRRGTPENMPPANKGLKKKVLKSLPKYKYDPSSTVAGNGASAVTAECAICLVEYVQGDEIRVLPQCGHVFHLQCVDTWLASHASCPSCRQILVGTRSRCRKCGEFTPFFGDSNGGSILPPAESRSCHISSSTS